MKILVTGGLGFIGSNFITFVRKNFPKYKITNLDAMLMGSNSHNLDDINKKSNYSFVKGNICNQNLLHKTIMKNDVIVNFAAETHVDRSIDDAKPFLKSNILGVHTLLEEILKCKKKLIQISTDEVFGSLKSGSAKETTKFNPSNPYSASKGSAELLVESYIDTHDCDANITRCTNNFGPKQSPEKLIPKVIILALKNQKIPIYGSGKNIRDWIFVQDHCEAIMNVIQKGKRGRSYNIAGKNELDNVTIVKKILKKMNKPSELISYTKDRPGHDFRYSLDSSRISRELRWKPKYNFERAIDETIEWYTSNEKWWSKTPTKVTKAHSWKTR